MAASSFLRVAPLIALCLECALCAAWWSSLARVQTSKWFWRVWEPARSTAEIGVSFLNLSGCSHRVPLDAGKGKTGSCNLILLRRIDNTWFDQMKHASICHQKRVGQGWASPKLPLFRRCRLCRHCSTAGSLIGMPCRSLSRGYDHTIQSTQIFGAFLPSQLRVQYLSHKECFFEVFAVRIVF